MLNRLILATVLSLGAVNALAEGDSWCRGYVIKALGEFPIQGFDRNDLWLAWNETVRDTLGAGVLNVDKYQSGRDSFQRQFEANNVAAMIETSDEECDQGRNSTWVWW